MFLPENLNNTILEKFVRKYSQDEHLFMQDDLGNTMYIILDGTILLFHKGNHVERLVGTLSAGEVLGEKAILTTAGYRRTLTAQAKTEATLLEIDSQNLKLIQSKIPDFTLKILKIICDRLDKANELITILQSTDPLDRLVQYLLYVCKHYYRKLPDGIALALTVEEIHHTTNLEKELVANCLDKMLSNRVIIKKPDGYVVSDENALLQFLPMLREQMAA